MNDEPKQVDAQTLSGELERGDALLVDVRDAAAYAQGHAAGALNIPIGDLEARLAELPADARFVTTCGGGTRGPRAAQLLREGGRDARVLKGGMKAWRGAGLPLTGE